MSEKPNIEIRQARVDDLPAILRFINACYGAQARFKGEPRWRWQFAETPYESSADGRAMVWLALHEGEVVGQMGLQPGRMFVDGEALPIGWNMDLMVRPEYRGLGLAHRIHGAMAETGRTLMTLTMAPASRIVFVRAGALTLPPVFEMVRPGRLSGRTLSQAILERTESRGRAVKLAGRVFTGSWFGPRVLAAGLSAGAAVLRGGRGKDGEVDITLGSKPDPAQAQALFERCLPAFAGQFDRGADFVDWRFRAPDVSYSWAQARRGGELTGLAAWRDPDPSEYPLGVLSDAWAQPGDSRSLDGLIEAAVADLASNCEAVIAGASDPIQIEALRRHGFWKVKSHHPTLMTIDPVLKSRIETHPRTWRFAKADSDFDQIYPIEP